MIVDLPNTDTRKVSKQLVRLRHDMGAMTLGRVLTLIVDVDDAGADEAVADAAEASRQSPSRIIVVVRGNRRGANRLDAQVRIGGDAGASEIVVLRLYGKLAQHGDRVVVPLLLPDSPVVAWWPSDAPDDLARSSIGAMAQRRIGDAAESAAPRRLLTKRADSYAPGDTDLAWTRLTRWRGVLAASLDQAPYESVTRAVVTGSVNSPSADLLAGWLAQRLKCPVVRARSRAAGLVSIRLERASGPIDLVRTSPEQATLSQPGQPVRTINLVEPGIAQALGEELRRLDADETYEATLVKGLKLVAKTAPTASKAVASDEAPNVAEARRAGAAAKRRAGASAAAAKKQDEPTAEASTEQVHEAAQKKLASKRTPAAKKAAGAAKAGTKSAPATKRAAKKASAGTSKKKAAKKAGSASGRGRA